MKKPDELKQYFQYWEITKDLIDQCIDIMLNLSQSGHPGGSRSKVHAMVATLLSGAMRSENWRSAGACRNGGKNIIF